MTKRTVTARLGERVLATSDRVVRLEGNYYFPREDVDVAMLRTSAMTTLCYWKGIARYRHLVVDDHTITNAAWTYPLPSPLAWRIRRMVAFDPGSGITVTIEKP